MTPEQRRVHVGHVLEALINSRSSLAAELKERRASYERSVRVNGVDAAFGQPIVAKRAAERIVEVVAQLAAVEQRIKTAEEEIEGTRNV